MKILIVDDEPLARERLARMLSNFGDCVLIGQAASGQEALALAEDRNPDVVFMDVRMPGMDGIAAAQHLAQLEPPPAVIFCTAYDDYAIEAFSSQAMGYLLKPVKLGDLEKALHRAKRVNKVQLAEIEQMGGYRSDRRSHITAKSRRGVDLIPVNEIRLFQADHKYVTAFYPEGEVLLDETLKELEDEFSDLFIRIHRNALVAIPHIEGLDRDGDGRFYARLKDLDIRPQVSRRHAALLKRLLEQL